MESQSDQQEQLRSRVQDLGSIFKGLVVALGLERGLLLFLFSILLLPAALLYTAWYLSSQGRPGILKQPRALALD